MVDKQPTYWSVQTGHWKPDDYADEIGQQYGYSSNVPNHRQLAEGDVVIVRDSDAVLGTGIIERIDEWSDDIITVRCPSCDRAKARYRKRTDDYRCDACGDTFEQAVERAEPGTWYRAWYGATWAEFTTAPTLTQLKDACAANPSQNAIERLDTEKALRLLQETADADQLASATAGLDLAPSIPGGHTQRLTRIRRGQARFRGHLVERFGANCAVTGPCPAEALEAAHLISYAEYAMHDVRQGLLLRADIHKLLDAHALGIDTASWTVVVAPELREHPAVGHLHGAPLALSEDLRPDPMPLDEHLKVCRGRW